MQNFEITKETLLSPAARTYVPLREKEEICRKAAALCVTDAAMSFSVGAAKVDLPDYHGRDSGLFNRLLLGALFHRYLGQDIDGVSGDPDLFAADDYDRAASRHPLNTLTRMKGDPALRDRVYDLLADYKELREMADRAILDQLAAVNDPVGRYLAAQTMAMTPEAIQTLSDAERHLQKQIKDLRKTGAEVQREIAAHGEQKKQIPEV